jgi:hypothetical protein
VGRSIEKIKSKSGEIESVNSPNSPGLQVQKLHKKEFNKNRYSYTINRQSGDFAGRGF